MLQKHSVHDIFIRSVAGFLVLALGACAGNPKDSGAPRGADAERRATPSGRPYSENEFAGRTAAEIDSLLGSPALSRREGAGEFRRYDFAKCAFMMVLYPDADGVSRVDALHAGALTADAPKPDLATCLAGGR